MRILSTAAMLSIGTVIFLVLAVPRYYTGHDERSIREELQLATPGRTLDEKTRAAIADGDIDLALQYASLAETLGKPISAETAQELEDAQGTVATVLRNAGDFAGAYITGRADSSAGLAGAVISDLTVVGDVRDIISEGGKAAVGEDYSQFLLTLAAIGLAAEGVTIATGGSSLVVKAAISVLKVAKRTGNLTAEFTTYLVRLARAATRNSDLAPEAIEAAARASAAAGAAVRSGGNVATGGARLSRTAARTELRSTLASVNAMAANAGASNAVKLMRFVRTGEDLRDLTAFTARFGRTSRAVADLTGKTALRAFRLGVRGVRVLAAFVWSMLAWVATLLGLRIVKGVLRSVADVVRGLFFTVAVP